MQHSMTRAARSFACALLFCLAAPIGTMVACGQETARAPRAYEVEGTVRRIDRADRSITIAHEDVPGYMPAMTMPFTVRDPQLFEGLAEGDRIRFRFVAEGGGKHVIQSVRKL